MRAKQQNVELLEEAKSLTPRNENGSFEEDQLLVNLAKLIVIDVDHERNRKAKAIIDSQCAVGHTESNGQLCLPGIATYAYEPQRLIRDDEGSIVEQDSAVITFKFAERKRATQNLKAAAEWEERKSEESDIFSRWVIEQTAKGRPLPELTWGECVRELGIWGPSEEENNQPLAS